MFTFKTPGSAVWRRAARAVAVPFTLALALGGPALSQPTTPAGGYPSKTLTLIVPYSTGTTGDTLARLLGAKLSERWGVAHLVDNKAGAAGVIGSEALAKAPPDGHTLMFTATSHSTVPAVRSKLPFDPIKSFAPVLLLGTSAMAVVVSTKLEAQTFKEFIALAKSKPGKLDYSTPGGGGVQHLAMELLMQETGTQLLHVPYKGSSGALTDVVGGHVQASVSSLQTAGQLVQVGKLKMLAVMGEERSPAFPQVPTLKELGHPSLVVDTWYGVLAPAGTPPEVVAKINAELNALLKLPEVREALAKQGVVPGGGTPERLAQWISTDITRWTKLVKTANIKTE
jgi:tripartite-type tricarboxylate transporter receptor subunit TctC